MKNRKLKYCHICGNVLPKGRKKVCGSNCAKTSRYQSRKKYESTHKELSRIRSKGYTEKLKFQIFKLLGNKCSNSNCLVPGGCEDFRCLQIDHVYGGGRKEIIEKFNGTNRHGYLKYVLEKIKKGSKDYQLLCANCNVIKMIENREFF